MPCHSHRLPDFRLMLALGRAWLMRIRHPAGHQPLRDRYSIRPGEPQTSHLPIVSAILVPRRAIFLRRFRRIGTRPRDPASPWLAETPCIFSSLRSPRDFSSHSPAGPRASSPVQLPRHARTDMLDCHAQRRRRPAQSVTVRCHRGYGSRCCTAHTTLTTLPAHSQP